MVPVIKYRKVEKSWSTASVIIAVCGLVHKPGVGLKVEECGGETSNTPQLLL